MPPPPSPSPRPLNHPICACLLAEALRLALKLDGVCRRVGHADAVALKHGGQGRAGQGGAGVGGVVVVCVHVCVCGGGIEFK